MIMKKTFLRIGIVRMFARVAAVAMVMLVLPLNRAGVGAQQQVTVSAHHSIQLADGTESNGGKGGGKGNSKLSVIA
jgi:hypothetical protein